jgi:plastocyanin
MIRRLHSPTAWAPGMLAGILLLSAAPGAIAQFLPKGALPADLANLVPYTGIATTYAYQPPMIPNSWITPNYVFDFGVPRVVYVPVAVPTMPQLPAVQPVRVAAVTLHRGAAPADVRVTPGSVVTWSNGDNAVCNLVLAQSPSSGAGTAATSQTWQIRAKGRFSLAFNQPGIYDYYRLEEPAQRARIIVSE